MADVVQLALKVIANTSQARSELGSLGESTSTFTAQISKSNSTLISAFGSLLTGNLSGFTRSLLQLITQVTNFQQKTAQVAQGVKALGENTGLSAQGLARLRDAISQTDAKASDGVRAYNAFYTAIKKAADTGNDPGFAKLGINVEQAFKRPAQAFDEFTKLLNNLPNSNARSSTITNLFGQGSGASAQTIEQLSGSLGRFAQESSNAGAAAGDTQEKVAFLSGSFAKMGGPVGVAIGLFIAFAAAAVGVVKALFDITEQAAKAGAKIQDLSDRTGVSVSRVQALVRAGQESGLSFEQSTDVISRSLDRFVSNMDKASETNGRTSKTFKQLGVDAKEGLKDVDPALDQTVKSLGGLTSATEFSAKAQEVFGQRNEQIALILRKIGPDMQAYLERMEALGGRVTPEATKQAKSFEESQSRLSIAFGGLKNVIGSTLIPVFQPLIDLITQVLVTARELLPLFFALIEPATGLARGVGFLGGALDVLNAILRSTPQLLNLVGAIIADVIKDFIQLTAVVGTAGQALAALVTGNFSAAASLGASAVQQAKTLVSNLASDSGKALDDLKISVGKNLIAIAEERKRLSTQGRNQELADINDTKKTRLAALDDELATLRKQGSEVERGLSEELDSTKRAFQLHAISLQTYEKQTLDAEKRALDTRKILFEQERKLINLNDDILTSQDKERRLEEVNNRQIEAQTQFNKKKLDIQAEQSKREDDAFLAFIALREKASDAADKAEIARVKAQADARVLSQGQAEERIAQIIQDGFERRRIALENQKVIFDEDDQAIAKIDEQIATLNAEADRAAAEAQTRIQQAQLKDLQALQNFLTARRRILQETTNLRLELLRQEAAAAKQQADRDQTPESQRDAIQAQLRAEVAAADVRHDLNVRRIQDEEDAAVQAARGNPELIEAAEQASHDRRLEEEQRFLNERRDLQNNAAFEENKLDPSSNESIFGISDESISKLQAFAQAAGAALTQVSLSAGNMKTILTSAFSAVGSGLQNILQSFILTGSTGAAAFKKLAAAVIASIAAQSLVKAVFEVAEGLANQAKFLATGDPQFQAAAIANFAAAKLYAVLGGGAAAIGLGIGAAGGLGGDSAGGGGSASASGFQQAPEKNLSVTRGNQFGNEDGAAVAREQVANGNLGPLMVFKQLADSVDKLHNKIDVANPGDVLVRGVEQRPDAVGNGVLQTVRSDHGFVRELGTTLGIT
jgi:hypothetical protein